MTKANDAARAHVKDAERRAKRKIKRLQSKGIRTGSISPLRNVDLSNTREAKKYAQQLEKFISRETRFVTGFDGTPIPYSAYREYQRTEREWNKAHQKYWGQWGARPFMTALGPSDMSVADRARMVKHYGQSWGDPGAFRVMPSEKLKGVSDIERRMKIMKKEMSPQAQKKRITVLRQNLLTHAARFNDANLMKALRRASTEQLMILANATDFVSTFYTFYQTDRDNEIDSVIDAMQDEAQKEHLWDLLKMTEKTTKSKTKKRKRRKK